MAVYRSLIVTWCLSMIPFVRSNIANNFDVSHPRVKRAQEAPWELTFDVPCQSCILTTKLGIGSNHQPDQVHLKKLHKGNKFPLQSKSIPLNKLLKRRLHVKRQVSPSPGMLHVIENPHYYSKKPNAILKLISHPRRRPKKVKRIKNNYLSRRRRKKAKLIRPLQSVLARRTRSTRVIYLPRLTTRMVVTKIPKVVTPSVREIAKTRSLTPYVETFITQDKSSVSSLLELETAALLMELSSQRFTTSFTREPSTVTTIVEDSNKTSESVRRNAAIEEIITTTDIIPNTSEVYMTENPKEETTEALFTTEFTTETLKETTPSPPFTDKTIDTTTAADITNKTTAETINTTVTSSNKAVTKEDTTVIPSVSNDITTMTLSLSSQEETTAASFIELETTGALTEIPNQINSVPSTLDNRTDTTISEHKMKMPEGVPRTAATEEVKRLLPVNYGVYTENVPFRQQAFAQSLDQFERRFYNATFGKLSSICPPDRRENGISFVESGLFLYAILTALCSEVDSDTKQELEMILDLDVSTTEKLNITRHILDSLPESGTDLKLRWSTRLLVNGSWTPSPDALDKLSIKVERIEPTATPEQLMKCLNHKVEEDSGGAMRNTFEEDELSNGVSGILLNTLYLRARWRSAPTLLNGTRLFRDAAGSPPRTARMIRINDIMRYAFLTECGAEALEISYSTRGLSLLLLVPRGQSLRGLSELVSAVPLSNIIARMRNIRVAATLPIYTLRMTLLLPNKLQAMGMTRLIDVNSTGAGDLRLSHAVQRIMFWAEAGRNAFKDDGIEWDEPPQLEMLVDRPYLFYVRWRNVTIMNGNFVL